MKKTCKGCRLDDGIRIGCQIFGCVYGERQPDPVSPQVLACSDPDAPDDFAAVAAQVAEEKK